MPIDQRCNRLPLLALSSLLAILFWSLQDLHAQSSRAYPTVRYVMASNIFLDAMPHNQIFVIRGEVPPQVSQVDLFFFPRSHAECPDELTHYEGLKTTLQHKQWKGTDRRFMLQMPPLQPSPYYCFQFIFTHQTRTVAQSVQVEEKTEFKPVMVIPLQNESHFLTFGFGGVVSPSFEDILPYVSVNLYFSPLSSAPLENRNAFLKRFSMSLGVTLGEPEDSKVEGITADRLVMLGVGYRVYEQVRLEAGGILFKKQDLDPLVDKLDRTLGFYVSASWEVDLVRWFNTNSWGETSYDLP